MFYNKFVLSDGTVLYDNIVSVSWTEQVNSDSDNITPGAVCANAIDISFWIGSDDTLKISQGTELTYYKIDDYTAVETKIGVFTCEKPEKDGSNKYKVTAYDNVTKLDIDVSSWLNALTFPVSISSFATQLATKCCLEFANSAPINGDYSVQAFTSTNVTGRELMKMVAQAAGSFIRANADGKLEYAWYVTNSDLRIAPHKSIGQSAFLFDIVPRQLDDNVHRNLVTTEGYHKPANDKENKSLYDKNIFRLHTADVVWEPESTPYFSNQLTFSDFTVNAIDKVQVKQSDDDVGVIYPGDATGTNALIVRGNKLLVTDSDVALRPYVKNLYDRLNNMVYVPCSNIQTPETIRIRAGDIVTVTDGKREFVTWITSVKHSGNKCTFESVGSIVRNTTTAVNNAKYSTKHRVAEIQANLDGISAKLGEYSTKSETESAISIAIDKIQLGITEKNTGDNLLDGGNWRVVVGSSVGTTGSVTIGDDGVATISAPDSTEKDKYKGVLWNVPDENLANAKGISAKISIDYKVEHAASYQGKPCHILFWSYYSSGNISHTLVTLCGSSQAEPAGDWKTATITQQFKNEVPTRVYITAYLFGGTDGIVSLRNPSIQNASNKESVVSLTKDGVEISSSTLNLNAFTSNDEVRSRFAMDASSVTIESGTITFKGNTLVVDSNNFKLTESGNVSITGSFKSSGSTGTVSISDGTFSMQALNADGNTYNTAYIGRTNNTYPSGWIGIYTRRSSGDTGIGCQIVGSDTDTWIGMYNVYRQQDISITTGRGNTSYFEGGLDVRGEHGLGVTRGISCRTLSAWEKKDGIAKTSFGNLEIGALECPEPMYADVGSGVCDKNGLCYIYADPRFAEAVSQYKFSRWIVTPVDSNGNLWVEKIDSINAIIHGKRFQKFDWICFTPKANGATEYAGVTDSEEPKDSDATKDLLDGVASELDEGLNGMYDVLESFEDI